MYHICLWLKARAVVQSLHGMICLVNYATLQKNLLVLRLFKNAFSTAYVVESTMKSWK